MAGEMLDNNGQPLSLGLRYHQNVDKAFENLLGMITGLLADKKLKDGEILFLDTWLKDQFYLRKDPDVFDLIDALDSVLADGVITPHERNDLITLISDILEYRDQYVYFEDDLNPIIKRTVGVINGIAADGELTGGEIRFLRSWLHEYSELKLIWPFSEVYQMIKSALEDGILTRAESESILIVLQQVVGGAFAEDATASGKSTTLPIDEIDCVEFSGKVFCFTGALASGTRKECAQRVIDLEGIFVNNITLNLDYLVIGPIASRDWFNTSYGRKIEKAVEYRDKKNTGLKIISEQVWLNSFSDI